MPPIRVHHTGVTDSEWDAGLHAGRLKGDGDEAYYRLMFAWQDPDADAETKGAYKLPHHMVSEGGDIGDANARACIAGIAALNGGRGGVDIPDGDRQGVWNHLAAHLEDAEMEPPALRSREELADPGIEVRTFRMAEVRVEGSREEPRIDGKAAVYGVPSEDIGFIEQIEPGFFEGALDADTLALFNHDGNFVLGRTTSGTLRLADTPDALEVHIRPPGTDLIRDLVLEPMRRGDIHQMSFKFNVKVDGDEWRMDPGGTFYRTLKRGGCARLYDVSVVTEPAFPQTSALVRSKLVELRSQLASAQGQAAQAAQGDAEGKARARLANAKRRLDVAERF